LNEQIVNVAGRIFVQRS